MYGFYINVCLSCTYIDDGATSNFVLLLEVKYKIITLMSVRNVKFLYVALFQNTYRMQKTETNNKVIINQPPRGVNLPDMTYLG